MRPIRQNKMTLNETAIRSSSAKREPLSVRRWTSFFRDSAYKAIYVVALVVAMTGWVWLLVQGAQWLYGL